MTISRVGPLGEWRPDQPGGSTGGPFKCHLSGPPDTSVGPRRIYAGRGGFKLVTRSGRLALPAVVAREPPQGSPRQCADLTRTPREAALLGMVGVRRVRAVRVGGRRGRASPGRSVPRGSGSRTQSGSEA